MFVLTADQNASTRHGDKVEDLLASLGTWSTEHADALALPLERTVGDEVQTVLTRADAALDLALHLMRLGEWAVGIGAGQVHEPLGTSSRASSGPAFVHARAAVERARGRGEPAPVVVAGDDEAAAREATALVQLLASVVRRRSAAGWEAADLLRPDVRQKDVANTLDISEQAVSQRVRSALLEEELQVRPLAAGLIARAAGERGGEDA
ncbi:hypothetical protein [Georgenia subflava]|uniref:DNA-binding protein n=1 Tax=Georgenia subflava TaxID=1622177 RepID=A0A6N7EMB3_9MICO|nr:hypothetical protein [Georgenia subflava]MPV37997.1 hypothetical protein [Georgenia subflava]